MVREFTRLFCSFLSLRTCFEIHTCLLIMAAGSTYHSTRCLSHLSLVVHRVESSCCQPLNAKNAVMENSPLPYRPSRNDIILSFVSPAHT